MKWTNKGHEFDSVYEELKRKEHFYLFGTGMYGEAMYEEVTKLGDDIAGYIDNNPAKQHTLFHEKEVFALDEIDMSNDNTAIIVCVSPLLRKEIIAQLQIKGYMYNKDFYTMEVYMSLKYVYGLQKMYISSISFLPSVKCNLNCEACLNFTPYLKNVVPRPWDEVKKDLDVFFSVVDYIMLFHISGGEPFIYPQIGELLTYMGEHYRDKIHYLQIVTNGTINIKDEHLELLKKYDIGITIDDYRDAVPSCKENFARLVERVKKYGIRHDVNKVDEWIDLAPLTTDHSDWSELRLQKHYESCGAPWKDLKDGRICSCNYASYASVAGFVEEYEDENFDLTTYTKAQMKELMEFRLGYSEKGYVEFCKKCAGFVDINENIVQPAKQCERKN